MVAKTYSRKRWEFIPLDDIRAFFGIEAPSTEPSQHLDSSCAPPIKSPRANSGKARPSLIGHMMIWQDPIGPKLRDGARYSEAPTEYIIPIRELVGSDTRHELHTHLRKALVFQYGLLYWQFRDWGCSKERTIDQVQTVLGRPGNAIEASYDGTMQDMREMFPVLCGFDHDKFRAAKKCENAETKKLSKDLKKRLFADCKRKIDSLRVGVEQAQYFGAFSNKIRTENVNKNRIPDPITFLNNVQKLISNPVHRQQLADIAFHGRINPRQLWPQFQHVEDLLDLLVFAGERSIGLSTPAWPELGDTFRCDVLEDGCRKICEEGAREDRRWFAEAVATVVKRPALAQAVQDLRTA